MPFTAQHYPGIERHRPAGVLCPNRFLRRRVVSLEGENGHGLSGHFVAEISGPLMAAILDMSVAVTLSANAAVTVISLPFPVSHTVDNLVLGLAD